MKAFCLLNHQLTENQLRELKEKYAADEIIYPAGELSAAWSQVKAGPELDNELIARVVSWLAAATPGDVLVVQGEFGTTFMLVDYALKRGLVPLHAVSRRVASETRDGETVSRHYIFEHVCFRKYAWYPGK